MGGGQEDQAMDGLRAVLGGRLPLGEVLHLLVEENRQFFFYIHDREGVFTYLSPSVQTITGRTPEEWMRHYTSFLTDNPLNDQVVENTQRSLSGEHGEPSYLVEVYHADGHKLMLEVFEQPFEDEGELIGLMGLAHDVSARMRAQQESERLEAELNHAQRLESVGQLAGGVAHDFNNLLTVITANVQWLRQDCDDDDDAAGRLDEIAEAAKQAAIITRQLLAIARKQAVKPRVLDLNRAVDEQRKMLERLAGEKARVEITTATDALPIKIDEVQLVQILINLVVNARDAGASLVGVETAPATSGLSGVSLRVQDDGKGMDADTQARVFDPFFTTKDAGRGTGLGLATVYGAVKQCGGTIRVHSEPGKGTRFELWFPAARQAVAGVAHAAPRELRGQETVLVVEDSTAVAAAVRTMLERAGYQVLSASSGQEALSVEESHAGPIHVLLSDVVLPGMNGAELIRAVSARRPGVKALLMSGYGSDERKHRGVAERGADLIEKPFLAETLLERVRRVLAED